MKASVKVVDNGNRIEGIASYGGWVDNCVIALVRLGGSWVVGTSITMPGNIDDAKIVFEAFRLTMEKVDQLIGWGNDSFEGLDFGDKKTNMHFTEWLEFNGISKPTELAVRFSYHDIDKRCDFLSSVEKKTIVVWMSQRGFELTPF